MENTELNNNQLYQNLWAIRKSGIAPSMIAYELNKSGLRTPRAAKITGSWVSTSIAKIIKPLVPKDEYEAVITKKGIQKRKKVRSAAPVSQKPDNSRRKISDQNLILEILTHPKISKDLALGLVREILG